MNLDGVCFDDPERRTWRALLGDLCPAPTLESRPLNELGPPPTSSSRVPASGEPARRRSRPRSNSAAAAPGRRPSAGSGCSTPLACSWALVLDLDLGDEDGLDVLPRIRATASGAKVLILTALKDRARDEAALRTGARGLVLKDAPPDVLLEAIRTVAAGGLWFDPRVRPPSDQPGAAPEPPSALSSLTTREREIVALIGEGLRNEEVARRLGITEKTVRNHLTVVFDKLGVSGGLELLVFAYEHGLARRHR